MFLNAWNAQIFVLFQEFHRYSRHSKWKKKDAAFFYPFRFLMWYDSGKYRLSVSRYSLIIFIFNIIIVWKRHRGTTYFLLFCCFIQRLCWYSVVIRAKNATIFTPFCHFACLFGLWRQKGTYMTDEDASCAHRCILLEERHDKYVKFIWEFLGFCLEKGQMFWNGFVSELKYVTIRSTDTV